MGNKTVPQLQFVQHALMYLDNTNLSELDKTKLVRKCLVFALAPEIMDIKDQSQKKEAINNYKLRLTLVHVPKKDTAND